MESHTCGLLCTLLSPNLLLSKSIHLVAWVRASSFLYGQITSCHVDGPHLHQRRVTGLRAVCTFACCGSGCYECPCTRVCVGVCFRFSWVHTSGRHCWSRGNSTLPFGGLTRLSQSGCIISTPPAAAVCEGPLFTSCPALTICCLILTILKGVMWHLIAWLTIKPNFHKPA